MHGHWTRRHAHHADDQWVGQAGDRFGMNFDQVIGVSAHECPLGASRGDGHSRWRTSAGTTYISLNDPDVGRIEASALLYKGVWQIEVSGPEAEPARCGTFEVAMTVDITPRPDGYCIARAKWRTAH